MKLAICHICHKPVGSDDHPGAQVSHGACAIESAYAVRGEDPADSGDIYKRACEKRAEQVRNA